MLSFQSGALTKVSCCIYIYISLNNILCPSVDLAGAIEVLAAVCRSPRKELRRLAVRALGALGWDGHTEVYAPSVQINADTTPKSYRA